MVAFVECGRKDVFEECVEWVVMVVADVGWTVEVVAVSAVVVVVVDFAEKV